MRGSGGAGGATLPGQLERGCWRGTVWVGGLLIAQQAGGKSLRREGLRQKGQSPFRAGARCKGQARASAGREPSHQQSQFRARSLGGVSLPDSIVLQGAASPELAPSPQAMPSPGRFSTPPAPHPKRSGRALSWPPGPSTAPAPHIPTPTKLLLQGDRETSRRNAGIHLH